VVNSVIETEQKYAAGDELELPDLAAALDGRAASVECHDAVVLDALYFDTDDLRLARSGATLRRRTGGEDAGWHLKLPTGRPGTRTELHAPLGEDVDVPAELADLVRARTRAKPLVPVLRLETVRTVTRLLAEDGSLLLEIADDRVLAEPNGAPSRTWREIEVERHSAGKGLVGRVDALLREAGASPAAWPSKVTHALGDVVPAAPLVPPARHDDLVTERLRAQRTEFVARDADVRRELPEAVHDMRVACRRLRSCLRTFGPLFEREPARHLLDELAWIAGVLGAERDLEVLEARIERSLAGLDDVEVTRAVRRILSERFDAGRAAAHAEILTALGGERYCQLLDELDVFASDPPFGVPLRARRVTRLRRLAAMELRRTRRWVERAEAAVGEERDHAFHQARKAAKRVRYAAEVLAPAYRGEARVVVERFTRLQDLLGERHDAVVARAMLQEEGTRAGPGRGRTGYAFGLLVGHEEAAIADYDRAFPRTWRRATRGKVQRLLG